MTKSFFSTNDEARIWLQARELIVAELRATHVIHYYDYYSIIVGEKIAPSAEELRMDSDRGL